MNETNGETQDRLRPEAAIAATSARGAGSYLADYAMAHPIRMAITIGAVTWWLMRSRDRSDEWDGIAETRWDDESPNPVGLEDEHRDELNVRRPLQETLGEYASTARETVGRAARSAGSGVDGFTRGNPMAAGAIALAIGAAIGLCAPRTGWEDSAMGETRDRVWKKAGQTAANLKDSVGEKMADAAENLIGESLSRAAQGTTRAPIGRA